MKAYEIWVLCVFIVAALEPAASNEDEIVKTVADYNQSSLVLKLLIQNCKETPFLVTRTGLGSEPVTTYYLINDQWKEFLGDRAARTGIVNNAGVYPGSREVLTQFARVYADAIGNSTVVARWGSFETFLKQRTPTKRRLYQDYLIKELCPTVPLIHPVALAPIELYEKGVHPWSSVLKGLRVLIVNPFAETMKKQYAKRKLIWKDKVDLILPEMDLLFYIPPVSIAGNQPSGSWIESFEKADKEIAALGSFDIALLSCGSYGLPLAHQIFKRGSSAIYVGGVLQIFFGIIGKRWEKSSFFKTFGNEHWVHPSESEKPKNAARVEGGSYW
eukprot:m.346754 g.346754  ORF g.346754 m.346754 type:complete len:330 (-) comp30293_c0_seq1:102-1091(-)